MDGCAVFGRQCAEPAECFVTAGRNEAGRNNADNVLRHCPVQSRAVAEKLFRIGQGRFRRFVTIVIGALIGKIHDNFADKGPLSFSGANVGEKLVRRRMDGTEVLCRRRSVCCERIDEIRIDFLREVQIFICRFEREGIVFQPDRQIRVKRFADLGPLRCVYVCVNESGQEELPFPEPGEYTRAF